MLWKSNQPTPPPPPIEAMPEGACELTEELCEFLGIPYLADLVNDYLREYAEGTAPELTFTIPKPEPRAPGPHVSHLGHSEFGGLCKRQLWLRYTTESGDKPLNYGQETGYQLGHVAEAWLAAVLEYKLGQFGWRVERNLVCDYNHPSDEILTGEMDMLISGEGYVAIRDRHEWTQFIVDCKKTSTDKLTSMRSPNASNVAQQQGYLESAAHGADFAILAYIAEWAKMKFFLVPRDSAETVARGNEVLAIHSSLEAPKVLEAKVEKGAPLKSNGSVPIKVKQPWQCGFCSYIDTPGCGGALPLPCRDQSKLWGHVSDGKFKTKPGMEPVVDAFGHGRLAELLLEG